MRQAIRALGWAATIFWIILLFFTITAAYSAFLIAQGLRFGEPTAGVDNGTLLVSLPLFFNDTGLYDISNFNVTTSIRDGNGSLISRSSTFVPLIPRASSNFTVAHNISLSPSQMTSGHLAYLLFNDSDLSVDAILKLNFARAIPLELATNISMPWGAPLYGLSIGDIGTPTILGPNRVRVTVPIIYENHAFFDLDGTVFLELVDDGGNLLGSGTANLLPRGGYMPLEIVVSNPLDIVAARLHFDTSYFSYGPLEIPLVMP
jgi:hypothetical protein